MFFGLARCGADALFQVRSDRQDVLSHSRKAGAINAAPGKHVSQDAYSRVASRDLKLRGQIGSKLRATKV